MRKCPSCGKWTLDFDEYFGRFRCYSADCGWMATSTAERELSLLQARTRPAELTAVPLPELDLTVTSSYDQANDALSVDLGLDEPTFDLPEPDGRMIWKIGYRTDHVAGFTILGAKRWNISAFQIDFIARRRYDIEEGLRRSPGLLSSGRLTRDVLEQIVVTAFSDHREPAENNSPVDEALRQVIDRFGELQPT